MEPLIAAFITKGLKPEKRLALTGAAYVLNGPLKLAPALVAAERERRAGRRPTGGGPVGPKLVLVPDVVGKPLDEARKLLESPDWSVSVSENESLENEKGIVLLQDPKPSPYRVHSGLTVHLSVGAGPRKLSGRDDHNRLETKIETLEQRLTEQSEQLRIQGEQLREQLREQLQDLTKAIKGQKG